MLGTVAFAGIGLSLAGRLRGEINLAAQNGLYLVLLLLGGMVIPFSELPGPIRAVARALPSGALADVLRESLTGAGDRPGGGVGDARLLGRRRPARSPPGCSASTDPLRAHAHAQRRRAPLLGAVRLWAQSVSVPETDCAPS